jgi:hypothetical protein
MRGQQQSGEGGGFDEQYWNMRDRQQMGGGMGMRDMDGMGMRGQRMGGSQARLMVVGQVTNENADLPGLNPNHQVAQIRTREGTTLFVDLGPSDQVQDLNLSQNASIFVQGQLTNVSGKRVIMAQRVGKVSQLTQINRSQDGQTYGFQGGQQQDQFRQQNQFRSQQPGQTDHLRSQQQRQGSSTDIYGFQNGQKDKDQSGQLKSQQKDKDQSSQMKNQQQPGQSGGTSGQSSISGQSGIADESKQTGQTDSTNR